MILYITWNIDPEIFRIGGFALRYYSLMFVFAFYFSYLLLSKIYKKENVSLSLLNKLSVYIFIGTIAGARLGHTLFYEFGYYKNHLLEIILPFSITNGKFELTGYQGLASHGAAIGIIIAVIWYCWKYKQSFLWIMDRLVIVVALSAFFIRIGNLFNSEIIGKPTNVSWAFIFGRVDMIPRHPAQLYEAISYLIIFSILWFLYKKKIEKVQQGFVFGSFLIMLFSVRFLVEFVKENQETFENTMVINMGQILSIPFILIGVILMISKSKQNGDKEIPGL
ncbi:prolipoprotein diacylglyceryl transferase [Flavihumibacter sp. ZG627]|uniref:prolipoprotein diacylglyceryl transferase n=1 Tax=Flavihumibacter sp. ZG627 TaxID=1463156 RepID=UPI00057DD943|nr:prolipoprotein diacylglyceryl transferase [Flavihumibacter sp. ZG627]KIC89872.1 prolipoprotein diacylglyceryl transferase [Flavihumibacter sp. ZG627]